MNVNEIGASCLGAVYSEEHQDWVFPNELHHARDLPDIDIQGTPTDEQIVNVWRLRQKAIDERPVTFSIALKRRVVRDLADRSVLPVAVVVESFDVLPETSSIEQIRDACFDVLAEGEAKEAWELLK